MDGTTNRQHGLQADSLGFLVGQRRIERITANIAQDTQEIVRLLKGMLQDRVLNPPDNQVQGLAAAIALSQRQATIDIVAAIRESSTNTQRLPIATRPTVDVGGSGAAAVGQVDTLPPVSTRPTVDVRSDADLPRNDVPPITDTNTPTPNAPDSTDSTSDDAAGTNAPPSTRTDYVRDARGRFVPRNRAGDADGAGGDDATAENTDGRVNNGRRRGANGRFEGNGDSKSWFDKFKNAVSGGVSTGMADTQGVDPTVDAINELGGLLSPMKKAAGFAFKPISMLMKRNKRSEPLPADQERHNREERKFWGRLVDAITTQTRSLSGMGGLGMLRMLPFVIPAVVAAVTAYLAKEAVDKANEFFDEKRPEEQGDINPDGSTNKGVIGAVNRFAKRVMNGVRGAANSVNAWLGGDNDYFDDGTAPDSVNRIGLKTDAVNQQGGVGGQAAAGAGQRTGRPQRGFTPDKAASIKATAERLGVNPNDLAAIISFETGGTFDPSIRNKPAKGQKATSATGLLQFIAGSGGTPGKYYGMTRDQFGALPFEQQMQYVEKYLKDSGIGGNKTSVADMYSAVLGTPASGYKEGTDAYAKNSKLDVNRNGVIERGEAVNNPTFLQHRKINFFPENAPQPAAPTQIPETSEGIAKLADGLPAPAAPVPVPAVTVPVPAPIPASNTQSMIMPAARVMSLPISASSARQAPNLPAMQPMPQIKERISSPAPQVVTIAQSADTIAQNVGDRAIAHAVTGGLGMRNTWEG